MSATLTAEEPKIKKQEFLTVINPPKRSFHLNLKELWEYRELIYFFVWRDVKVRYKQTLIGVAWVVIQPLVAMLIFSVFFGRLAKMPSDGVPYPIFVYVGLLLWNYFSFSLNQASTSMVSNANIIRKIYFPRLVVPLSSSMVGLVDFVVASGILVVLMIYYHYVPKVSGLLYLPLLVVMTFFSAIGLGSLLAALNVKYRDVRYALPYFIQMLMFLTPVIYPVSIVGEKYKWVLALNPMSGVIDTARAVILGVKPVDWLVLSIGMVMSVVLFVGGVIYFRKTEKFFADII